MRYWRIAFFAGVLIAAVVGLANGHLGSGLFWGLLAAFALTGEVLEARRGGRGSLTLVFLYAIVLSGLLAAVAVGVIVSAVLAPSEEARNRYIATAVLVTPIAALAWWATITGYRRIRRMQLESHPQRSGSEIYAELITKAHAQQSEKEHDPQRKRRQRWLQLYLGIAAIGWGLGRIVGGMDEEGSSALLGLLMILSLLLMLGGVLAAGWTAVWVFKDRSDPGT